MIFILTIVDEEEEENTNYLKKEYMSIIYWVLIYIQ